MSTPVKTDWQETTFALIWTIGLVLMIAGWLINIYKLLTHGAIDFETGLRIIGIFIAPLGGILGYL